MVAKICDGRNKEMRQEKQNSGVHRLGEKGCKFSMEWALYGLLYFPGKMRGFPRK